MGYEDVWFYMLGASFKVKINILLCYRSCLCSVFFDEADNNLFSEKFLYVLDVSGNSDNNKITGLEKNEKKNGKLTVIIGPSNCYLKVKISLV